MYDQTYRGTISRVEVSKKLNNYSCGVLPVLQKMTDRRQKRPKTLPVLHKNADREHPAPFSAKPGRQVFNGCRLPRQDRRHGP